MKLLRGLGALKNSSEKRKAGCVATIGNFDGLHLGHQKIISKLKEKANQYKLPLTIISFEPLPTEYFMPNPPARVYPMRDKIRLLKKLGVDEYLCLKFDKAFANQSPKTFIQEILLDKLNVKYLAVGDDFKFGHKREGDFNLLKEMGEPSGMQVTDTKTCSQNNERISSSRIRKLLEAGDIQSANKLLGHNYQLSGRIRHGDKRGRTIGFPTLNLRMLNHIAPSKGVYAVKIHGLGNVTLLGVANLGTRPTVSGDENRLEVHLFDFDKEVYGQYICVELVEFLRPEKKFDDFNALKTQIVNDAENSKEILRGSD